MYERTHDRSARRWQTSGTMSCSPANASRMPRMKRCRHSPTKKTGCLLQRTRISGELVFLRGLPHPSIVRLVGMTPIERADAMRNLIACHSAAMRESAIIAVTENRVRIRSAGNLERGHD